MNGKAKFFGALALLFTVLLSVLLAISAALWFDLGPAERRAAGAMLEERAGLIAFLGLLALTALGMGVAWLFRNYVAIPKRLSEDIQVMLTANSGHRAKVQGPAELKELARLINSFALSHESLKRDVEARIAEAKASLEEEKNRLAALMSELAQGVLVCNLEGRILLYNPRARELFTSPSSNSAGASTGSPVGLGRSIFGIIDRHLIAHALETLGARQQQDRASAHFVTTTSAGALLRAQMAPVLSQDSELTGFVLTLEDITKTVEAGSRRDAALQSLTEGSRAALANIRAAVETLETYPDMEPERKFTFIRVIGEEAAALSVRLDQVAAEHADSVKTRWPLEDMAGDDLVAIIQRRIEGRLGIVTKTEEIEPALWLSVDSFSLAQAYAYLAGRLKDEFHIREVRLRLTAAGRHAQLDLIWGGTPIAVETLHTWENEPFNLGGEASPLTLKDVLGRHGGEGWYQLDKAAHSAYFRMLLPLSHPVEPVLGMHALRDSRPPTRALGGRPEYYDFDLFHQPDQSLELDERPLVALAYTVFDTETTGLNPSSGDEIISIGAVRIVNGRLLRHEAFDQLIDPRRPLPRESVAIHGIEPAMLKGQPAIEEVLPLFHRFCEDTVLVAHNAAFDLRFLQIKEASTGIKFTQPVLDTLLLSAFLHPNQEAHRLEDIAQRLGVSIIGRHTALGDAIVTGEVFLKMISLLAERGIRTLRQAREAARQTFYARVKY